MSQRFLALIAVLTFFSRGLVAGLQVFPPRIELSDTKKLAHISLRHTGDKPAQYRLSTIFYRMNADGTVAVVEDAKEEERPATKLIKFSPHQVTLSPNVEQVLRVRVSAPQNLPEGEYRAHIHVVPTGETDSDEPKKNENKVMRLEARVAIAVPVIFRHGKTAFTAALSNLTLVKGPDNRPAFSVELSSEGNAFPYGDFLAFYVNKGKKQPVGVYRGVASFLTKRTVSFPLDLPADSQLSREVANEKSKAVLSEGQLVVEFHHPMVQGQEGELISAIETKKP